MELKSTISTGSVAIANAGAVHGLRDAGVYLYEVTGAMSVTNAATGQIVGTDDEGIDIYESTGSVSVTNAGFIEGGDEAGVYVDDDTSSGSVTISNAATGNITGYDDGLYLDDVTGGQTITNSGLIWGEFDYGVYLDDVGSTSISNGTTTTLTAAIKGEEYGIYDDAFSSAVTLAVSNYGLIAGTNGYGIYEELDGGPARSQTTAPAKSRARKEFMMIPLRRRGPSPMRARYWARMATRSMNTPAAP